MGYKKYINDYKKEYIVKPNGKPGLTAVYVGKYYRFTADESTLKKAKVRIAFLTVLAVALTIVPFFYKSVGAKTLFVSLPHVLSLFPLLHLVLGAGSFCFRESPMIREHKDKSEARTVNSAVASMIILGITAVLQGVNCFLAGHSLPEVAYFLLLSAASAACGAVFFSRNVLKTEECTSKGDRI